MENTNILLLLILITIFVVGVAAVTFLLEISEYLKLMSKDIKEEKVNPRQYLQKAIFLAFYILIAIIVIFFLIFLFFQ
tara:strand:- start:1282 stop:1515 length:234 start_codon:yes stop_codon:yes gene_type:complete